MNWLVDAQLPKRLATRLTERGHDAVHTLDLASGNRSTDSEICILADREERVVVTKDADFVDSHILSGSPERLLLVSTGNIGNRELFCLVDRHLDRIVESFSDASFVELTAHQVVVHS